MLDDDPPEFRRFMISLFIQIGIKTVSIKDLKKNNLFYVLTNSVDLQWSRQQKAHHEIAQVVDEVAQETGKEYIFISRSDSTFCVDIIRWKHSF